MNRFINRVITSLLLAFPLCACAQPAGPQSSAVPSAGAPLPTLDSAQAAWVGEQIFANECNRQIHCLTSWNAGEDFPSLGIGHFIWYRQGQQEAFVESFPLLLAFYQEQGVSLPAWISQLPQADSPWQSRDDFQQSLDGAAMVELRDFLNSTRDVQVAFIVRRMEQSLPRLLAATSRPGQVEALFREIAANQPLGIYALIDYINFKGDGTAPAERYAGQGWGLLQVLEYMLDHADSQPLMTRFSTAASAILERRIANSPPDRGEERWRAGWNNRVATYAVLPTID